MKNNKISFAIISQNINYSIEKCIKSIWQCADEIVIIDSGSSDVVLKNLKKKYKKIKIFKRNFDFFSAQRNYSLLKCINDWVFVIDCDECLSLDLAQFLVNSKLSEKNFYAFPRKNYFFGKILNYSFGKDYQIRLFQKSKGEFKGLIHERFVTKNKSYKLKKLNQNIIHFGDLPFEQRILKIERYSKLHADMFYKQNKSISFVFFRFLKEIFTIIFIRFGFLDGRRCLMWVLIRFKYQFNIMIHLLYKYSLKDKNK